jgi:hypothetical protein
MVDQKFLIKLVNSRAMVVKMMAVCLVLAANLLLDKNCKPEKIKTSLTRNLLTLES